MLILSAIFLSETSDVISGRIRGADHCHLFNAAAGGWGKEAARIARHTSVSPTCQIGACTCLYFCCIVYLNMSRCLACMAGGDRSAFIATRVHTLPGVDV